MLEQTYSDIYVLSKAVTFEQDPVQPQEVPRSITGALKGNENLSLGFLFCSIDLYVCLCASTILFWWLWLCSRPWSQAGWFLQFHSSFSRLLWLFEVFCIAIQIVKLSISYLFIFSDYSFHDLVFLTQIINYQTFLLLLIKVYTKMKKHSYYPYHQNSY